MHYRESNLLRRNFGSSSSFWWSENTAYVCWKIPHEGQVNAYADFNTWTTMMNIVRLPIFANVVMFIAANTVPTGIVGTLSSISLENIPYFFE